MEGTCPHLLRLSQKLRGLESMREQYEHEIERKRECLSGIQPTLQAVLEAAQPLQADLGLPLQARQGEHANAQYLARPLYMLYVQATAYQHAYGEGASFGHRAAFTLICTYTAGS